MEDKPLETVLVDVADQTTQNSWTKSDIVSECLEQNIIYIFFIESREMRLGVNIRYFLTALFQHVCTKKKLAIKKPDKWWV